MNIIFRNRVVTILKFILAIGLLIFLVNYIQLSQIKKTFSEANQIFLVIVLLILPINLYLQFLKWKIITHKFLNISDNNKIARSLFYGISAGIFTPMKSGEYVARAIPFKDSKLVDVVLSTVIDKFIPIIFVVIIGGIFFIFFIRDLFELSTLHLIVVFILYLLIISIPLYLFNAESKFINRIKDSLKKNKYYERIYSKVTFLKKLDRKMFLKLLTLSLLYHLTFTIQMTLLFAAFTENFNFFQYFYIANLVIFVQVIIPPIALGEIGIREGAAVYFVAYFGLPAAVGFNAALTLFIINLLLPSLVGLLFLFKKD